MSIIIFVVEKIIHWLNSKTGIFQQKSNNYTLQLYSISQLYIHSFFYWNNTREKSPNVITTQHWSQPPHSGSDSSLGTTGAFVRNEDGGFGRKRPTTKARGRVVLQEWMDDYSRLSPPIFLSFYSGLFRSVCRSNFGYFVQVFHLDLGRYL